VYLYVQNAKHEGTVKFCDAYNYDLESVMRVARAHRRRYQRVELAAVALADKPKPTKKRKADAAELDKSPSSSQSAASTTAATTATTAATTADDGLGQFEAELVR
jgi:hypothetical protein